MNRLLSTLRWDMRLQFRSGFYYAAAFVGIIMMVALTRIPADVLNQFLPVFLLENLLINTFYFIGGLVLLEKGQGILEGLVVTPLRRSEYLASKITSLTLLSLLENLLIIGVVTGLNFRLLLLLTGIAVTAVLYTLFGFLAIVRYDTINEYLFPSFIMTTALSLPMLPYFDVWPGWWVYLHPIQAPFILLQAAFRPVAHWQIVYAVGYAAVWIAGLALLCRNAFYRFIILKEGVR